ncbi:MAG TPA: hypothetical protein ENL09_03185 [Bacteroidetes bacterium]|nr:hypothetical protein [Bacteroidota bacterium]
MKIENYFGTASTFTWPNNPNVFDDAISSNYTITNIDYQRYHIFVSGGGIPPKQIVLTGHFFGTNKNTNYRTLSGHFIENTKLKKLYFDSDRFYLGVGKAIKKTHSGGRTNFIDYVATFETIVGVLFDDTLQTHTDGGAEVTNSGNVTTLIEEIKGYYDGSGDVVITDTVGVNQITIPAASCGSADDEIIVTFVKMVDSGDGIFVTEYNYTTVAGTQIETVRTTDGFGVIQLGAGRTTSDISVTNLKS